MMKVRHLLWLDSLAAATASLIVLLLSAWLSDLHRLPQGLLVFIGGVNALYARYALSLAVRPGRSRSALYIFITGNAAWAGACLAMAWRYADTMSGFGYIHLVGEEVFVGTLAACEWRWRDQLAGARRVMSRPPPIST